MENFTGEIANWAVQENSFDFPIVVLARALEHLSNMVSVDCHSSYSPSTRPATLCLLIKLYIAYRSSYSPSTRPATLCLLIKLLLS